MIQFYNQFRFGGDNFSGCSLCASSPYSDAYERVPNSRSDQCYFTHPASTSDSGVRDPDPDVWGVYSSITSYSVADTFMSDSSRAVSVGLHEWER